MSGFPQKLRSIFWSADLDKLDLQTHKKYIIHQVLHYGDVTDFKWLKKQYSLPEIKKVFISQPSRIYSPQSFNFTKNFLLKIKQVNLNRTSYVSTLS